MYSDEYLALLKNFEGFYSQPYLCPAGVCTIGYGTNLEAHRKFIPYVDIRESHMKGKTLLEALKSRGMKWSEEEATEAMISELNGICKDLVNRIPVFSKLIENKEKCRSEALLDMAYNMGVTGLSRFKNTLKLIDEKEYKDAAWNLVKSKWYNQVKRRGRAIFYMMFYGQYPKPSEIDKLPNYHFNKEGIGVMRD